MVMKAGFAIRDITPRKMYPMSGYDLRKETAVGVHDALHVRALVLEEGRPADGNMIVMISVDLLGAAMYVCSRIRTAIREALKEKSPGLQDEQIEISAIHTHAAPKAVFSTLGCYDEDYVDQIARSAGEAAGEAYEHRHECRVMYGTTAVSGVGSYRDRDRAHSEYSMPCDLLYFQSLVPEQMPILMTTYACHPTVLNEKNLLMSCDMVWGCQEALKEKAPNMDVMFLNGACADISTRYTREASSFEDALRIGTIWAEGICKALQTLKTAPVQESRPMLSWSRGELFVPPAVFFEEKERTEIEAYLSRKIETCADEAQKREYIACRSVLRRSTYGAGTHKGETVLLSAVRIGDFTAAFLPFEYASPDAYKLKEKVTDQTGGPAAVICYSNGYEGYLPSGRPLDQDSGYEDMASVYRSDAKLLVAEKIVDLTDQLA